MNLKPLALYRRLHVMKMHGETYAESMLRNGIKMVNKFKREDRYVVFKISDLNKITLGFNEISALGSIKHKINLLRAKENRRRLKCLIVESDWPMYEDVWKQIEEFASEDDKET